jgi:biotin transport system substrate-specific component
VSKINIRQMTLISLFASLTAVGAFISIPIYPVPLTLQTLFTLLVAMTLGSVMGASSQIIYVLLGVIGLPVFAGFKNEKNIFYYFLAGIIGTIILYIIGITQLSLVTGIGIKKAIAVGMLPFLPGDILKIIAASFIASKLKPIIELK